MPEQKIVDLAEKAVGRAEVMSHGYTDDGITSETASSAQSVARTWS